MLKVASIQPAHRGEALELPIFYGSVRAGFPTPAADDHFETKLDLNAMLVKQPSATFFVRVEGDAMHDVGMWSGDLLVVDRSLTATDRSIVIAALDGDLLVRRLRRVGKRSFLEPEPNEGEAIEITEETNFEVWGVVTYVIHSLENR